MQREPITDRARGRWLEILPALGVDAKLLGGKHCPCPVCGGTDRFRFDNKEQRGTFICNHCGAGDGVKLVMLKRGLDFRGAAEAIEEIIGTAPGPTTAPGASDAKRKAAFVQKVMAELRRASVRAERGDPVDLYLRSRVPGLAFVPSVLRTVMRAEHRSAAGIVTYHPVMLATVADLHGDPIAMHRTFLTMDGAKAAVEPGEVKMNLGPLPDGVAIRLAKANTTILGVAEGIETALSAMALYRIPVWSTMNAGRLEAWSPPEGINEVVIFGDNDANSVGQAAAYALALRLNRTIIAQVVIPPEVGSDWNDVHRAKTREAA